MAVVFTASHESNNFSEYTASVTDGGDLSTSTDSALASTAYGMKCVIDDTTSIYAYKALASAVTTGVVRYRFYIDPNSITMSALTEHTVVIITDISSNPVSLVLLHRTNTSEYGIYCVCVQDGGGHLNSQIQTITDAPHYIEVQTVRATTSSSTDGYTEFWVDGTYAYKTVLTDNYDQFNDFQIVIMGAPSGIDAGTSGTFYLDELVVNDDGGAIGPVSGTEYTQSVAGGITPSGALIKQANKIFSGSLSSSGAISKLVNKSAAGGITPAGAIAKLTSKIVAGAISTIEGALAYAKTYLVDLSGSLGISGALAKQTNKTVSGAIALAGTITKNISKIFGGTIIPAGIVTSVRTFVINVGGTLASAGAVIRSTSKSFTGSITPAGAISKLISKIFGGTITPTSAIVRTPEKVLSGSITPTGDETKLVSKLLAGTLVPAGGVAKEISKILSGILAAAGDLIALALGITADGTVSVSDSTIYSATVTDTTQYAATITDAEV